MHGIPTKNVGYNQCSYMGLLYFYSLPAISRNWPILFNHTSQKHVIRKSGCTMYKQLYIVVNSLVNNEMIIQTIYLFTEHNALPLIDD